jgi:hypothetical protein
VFSRTVGFRHDSIADAHEFFKELDSEEQLSIEVTEDAAALIERTGLVRRQPDTGATLEALSLAVVRTASRHSRRGGAFNSSSCRGKP